MGSASCTRESLKQMHICRIGSTSHLVIGKERGLPNPFDAYRPDEVEMSLWKIRTRAGHIT